MLSPRVRNSLCSLPRSRFPKSPLLAHIRPFTSPPFPFLSTATNDLASAPRCRALGTSRPTGTSRSPEYPSRAQYVRFSRLLVRPPCPQPFLFLRAREIEATSGCANLVWPRYMRQPGPHTVRWPPPTRGLGASLRLFCGSVRSRTTCRDWPWRLKRRPRCQALCSSSKF